MAAAKAPPKIYRVVSPFIAWEDGHEVPYLVNDIVYTADHPAVKKNGGNFVEVVPVGPAGRRAVEDTTANPGETR